MQKQIDINSMNEELQKLKKEFEKFKEDLAFAQSTEEGWKEIDEGKYKKMSVSDFISEIKTA